jgi:molybdopterin/thiamine biosynthesis adenylyltransferase
MIEFRFLQKDLDGLRGHLLRGPLADEEAAWLLAGWSREKDSNALLIRDVIPIPDQGLLRKGKAGLSIDPVFFAPLIKRSKETGSSVILCHSHPFSDSSVDFSFIDNSGEQSLFPKILARNPEQPVGAIVFGQRSARARVWMPSGQIWTVKRLKIVGTKVSMIASSNDPELSSAAGNEIYSRQVLAFTEDGQRLLSRIRVGIVGLGGLGSHVLQLLTHLGVGEFVLIDPDRIDSTNLSRLIGASADDIGQSKAEVLKQKYREIFPRARIEAVPGDVYHLSVASNLKSVDVIFGCTDTMVSRMVLTRFPHQYYVPLIDTGINIQASKGEILRIGGRVMSILPEDPCLDCLGYLDDRQLERDLSGFGQVGRPQYVTGLDQPEPAVVSYNSVVAALAVNEFLRLFLPGLPVSADRTFQVYNGLNGTVRRVSMARERDCGVCTEVLGRGDAQPLPCLQDR